MDKRIHKHKKNRNKHKKRFIFGMCICALASIYVGGAAFFKNHFYFGSQINGINVSGKTVKQATEEVAAVTSTYSLELQERGGNKEKIDGKDIGLVCNPEDKIKNFKDSQKSYKWVTSFVNKRNEQIDNIITFDKELVKKNVDKLSIFNSKSITEPKDASLEYTDKGYNVVSEVEGNKINKDVIYKNVENAILEGKSSLDLNQENCYEKPKYTAKSKEIANAKDLLNKYTSLKVTYTFGDAKEVVNGSMISKWIDVDKNMNVVFDEKKIKAYVTSLASKYNTFSNSRSFATSVSKTVQVVGGDYGWVIDKSKEVKDLIEVIKKGKDATKEPIYSQKAFSRGSNDIGNTYVEINMTKQHMWFYKNGALVTDGDVVTGNLSLNCGTPVGTYSLTYKEKNATLKGENYAAPVDYWLPFNGNIGIHDASWRTEFGKDIYVKNGSHGCINSPHELAGKIFDNIQPGTPVICYTE